MIRMTGAELIVELIKRQGVDTVFGIPGGMNLPLYDALARLGGLKHVLARHEQGAGFMAQGMARATGLPGVCLATSGPGAANLLTALADARADSVPLVAITGQVPLGLIGTDAFQEMDTVGASLPLTKHNRLIRSAAELLEAVPAAFRIAASGRPGPVLLDVPKDVQNQAVEFAAWPEPGLPEAPPGPAPAEIERAAALINASRRPVLYLGGGAQSPRAAGLARELAERAGMPVALTLMGLGAFPSGHPLLLGMLGMHGARSTNQAMDEADLLVVAGARFDDRATGALARFCPHAKIIHFDIDPAELHKLRRAEVAVHGDLSLGLAALLPLVEDRPREDWRARVEALKAAQPLRLPGAHDLRSPYGLVLAAARALPADCVITTDVGQHQMWTAQAFPFTRPRQWLTSGGAGTMGFGLPAAIGAALALPGRAVACFTGDGSLLMNLQELATLAEEGVALKIVLFDNRGLGLVHQQQHLFFGSRYFGSGFRTRTDFPAIARGFGLQAVDLELEEEPSQALAAALSGPGTVLVRAPIAARARVYPMVPPLGANTEAIDEEEHQYA